MGEVTLKGWQDGSDGAYRPHIDWKGKDRASFMGNAVSELAL